MWRWITVTKAKIKENNSNFLCFFRQKQSGNDTDQRQNKVKNFVTQCIRSPKATNKVSFERDSAQVGGLKGAA